MNAAYQDEANMPLSRVGHVTSQSSTVSRALIKISLTRFGNVIYYSSASLSRYDIATGAHGTS